MRQLTLSTLPDVLLDTPANSILRYFSCVINDEFKHELPPNFNALHFVVAETTDGCSTRPLGRVTIRRKDLVEQAMMDQWLPIMPFSKTQTTEIVGDLCLDVDADPAQRTVAIR